jgi:hypothetical protein
MRSGRSGSLPIGQSAASAVVPLVFICHPHLQDSHPHLRDSSPSTFQRHFGWNVPIGDQRISAPWVLGPDASRARDERPAVLAGPGGLQGARVMPGLDLTGPLARSCSRARASVCATPTPVRTMRCYVGQFPKSSQWRSVRASRSKDVSGWPNSFRPVFHMRATAWVSARRKRRTSKAWWRKCSCKSDHARTHALCSPVSIPPRARLSSYAGARIRPPDG